MILFDVFYLCLLLRDARRIRFSSSDALWTREGFSKIPFSFFVEIADMRDKTPSHKGCSFAEETMVHDLLLVGGEYIKMIFPLYNAAN